MSEYQFYEFKSIDKPLSKEDKNQVGSWSSRTNPSNTGAIFTYSYSDFPKDEITVVEKYFDAMFYISNWGTTRLIFKFPKELFELNRVKQYCVEDGLNIIEKSNWFLLDIEFSDEEGDNWIEGEGWLSSLVSLRNDILNGDYRALYLIWLKNSIDAIEGGYSDLDQSALEPEIPMQLTELNGSLQDLVEVFDIDKDYITAATESNQPEIKERIIDFKALINELPENEKDEYLVRLINGEALLNIKLKNRLKEFLDTASTIDKKKNRRNIGELARQVKKIKEVKKRKKKKQHEESCLKKMKNLELHENEHWTKVYQLISEKKTKAYDEAITLLKDLKELSIHKNRFNDYCNTIETIKKNNSRLPGLINRILRAKLNENEKTSRLGIV